MILPSFFLVMAGPCILTFNILQVPTGNLEVIKFLFVVLVAVIQLCRNVFRPIVDPKQDKAKQACDTRSQ